MSREKPLTFRDIPWAGSAPVPSCPYCGGWPHIERICPRIKVIEYYPDGTVKRLELY